MKVEIISCSNNKYWYLYQIGSVFNVCDESEGFYSVEGYESLEIVKSDCRLIYEEIEGENNNTNRIPFSYEKYKSGSKAVYRDGREPLNVYFIKEAREGANILSINENYCINFHYENGAYDYEARQSPLDLFLIEKNESKIMYANVIHCNYYPYTDSTLYDTLDHALKARSSDISYLGDPVKIIFNAK